MANRCDDYKTKVNNTIYKIVKYTIVVIVASFAYVNLLRTAVSGQNRIFLIVATDVYSTLYHMKH